MLKIINRLYFLFIGFSIISSSAQNRRYIDPVFNEIDVSNTIELAQNYSIIEWIKTGGTAHTLKQSLVAKFYTPKGDTKSDRPLIIYVHTGNFSPYPVNGLCSGTLTDSSNVEIATRLAKMGYVVAVVNYRQGWNPFQQNTLTKRFSLINALYRSIQDINTYIRYFRKSVDEFNNPYGINPSQITVWGDYTGGSIALTAAYLKSFAEFHPPNDPDKFLLPTPIGNVSMITENYTGNIYGDGSISIVDESYHILTGFHIGDTLCISNHVGYPSDFALVVNMGGALADSSWLDAGEIPLITFHHPSDPIHPCDTSLGLFLEPQTIPPLETTGSCDLAKFSDNFRNNDVFKTIPVDQDPFGKHNQSEYPGFYSFYNTPDDTSLPWQWAKADNPPSTCNKDAALAKTYIDTIVGYFAPRACVALGLNCDFNSSVTDLADANVNLKMSPNPATTDLFITVSDETPIKSYTVFNISGRMVRNYSNVNASAVTLKRESLQNGLYLVKMQFDGGTLTKKVIFE